MPKVLNLEAQAAEARARITAYVEDRERRKAQLLEAVEQYRARGIALDLTDYERVGASTNV